MNAGILRRDYFDASTRAEQIATMADSQDLPGIAIDQLGPRKGSGYRSYIIGTVSTEQAGLPAERSRGLCQKGYALNDRLERLISKDKKAILQRKTQ